MHSPFTVGQPAAEPMPAVPAPKAQRFTLPPRSPRYNRPPCQSPARTSRPQNPHKPSARDPDPDPDPAPRRVRFSSVNQSTSHPCHYPSCALSLPFPSSATLHTHCATYHSDSFCAPCARYFPSAAAKDAHLHHCHDTSRLSKNQKILFQHPRCRMCKSAYSQHWDCLCRAPVIPIRKRERSVVALTRRETAAVAARRARERAEADRECLLLALRREEEEIMVEEERKNDAIVMRTLAKMERKVREKRDNWDWEWV